MKHPAQSRKAVAAAGFLVLLLLGMTGPVRANKKPKFVYVANSGESVTDPGIGAMSPGFETFRFTATATCANYRCASTISISGSFTLNLYYGEVTTGTIFLSDPSDLVSSPLALPFYYQRGGSPPFANVTLYFGQVNPGGPYSDVSLVLPFSSFPGTYYASFLGTYSGGPFCTSLSTSVCSSISGIDIGMNDMSAGMRATTGGTPINATISSGSVTTIQSTQGSNSVSGYAVNSTTGALTLLHGSPFAAGSDPCSVAVDPSNKFVYVANRGSNNISAYVIDGTTGALSQVAGSPFAAGSAPSSIGLDPLGKFVYVANQGSNNVSAYTLDSETGALAAVNGSPFAAGDRPISLTLDPLGKYVYVTNGAPSSVIRDAFSGITAYAIDRTTGALKSVPGSPFGAPATPLSVTVDSLGKFLYVAGGSLDLPNVAGYTIDTSTGSLTGLWALPGDIPSAVAADPSGNFLYVTENGLGNDIFAYTIDSTTGGLKLVKPLPFVGALPTEVDPISLAVDPSGKFVYVANILSKNISAYRINGTTGALAPIPGSPFPAGVAPASVAIASSSTTPFSTFLVKAEIDEDRKTTFRVGGYFELSKGNDGIHPLSEPVTLSVGSYTVTIPAGSFRERGGWKFEYEGWINDVEVKMAIYHIEKDQYLFGAEGKGRILSGIVNPVTVGLAIGDDEGSTTVKADIDK